MIVGKPDMLLDAIHLSRLSEKYGRIGENMRGIDGRPRPGQALCVLRTRGL